MTTRFLQGRKMSDRNSSYFVFSCTIFYQTFRLDFGDSEDCSRYRITYEKIYTKSIGAFQVFGSPDKDIEL